MRKRSKAQRAASRRNGAQSRGPITAAGKAIVSHNAITHRLTAKVNIISTEERPAFDALLHSFVATFAPQSDPEFCAVEEMATARWRQQRVWILESTTIDKHAGRVTAEIMSKYGEEATEPLIIASAVEDLADNSNVLALLMRYEARL